MARIDDHQLNVSHVAQILSLSRQHVYKIDTEQLPACDISFGGRTIWRIPKRAVQHVLDETYYWQREGRTITPVRVVD